MAFTVADIRHNSLSMVPDYQNAFDSTVNYNVLNIGIVESSNQLSDARVICPTIDLCNNETIVTEPLSVYIVTVQRLNREYWKDSIAERTSLLLSDSQFCI